MRLKDELDATADWGLDAVRGALDPVYDGLVPIAAAGGVSGLGCVVRDRIGVALVRTVAPDFGGLAIIRIRLYHGVMGVGGGGHRPRDLLCTVCRTAWMIADWQPIFASALFILRRFMRMSRAPSWLNRHRMY